MEFRPEEFDSWAAKYDDEVMLGEGFPFSGYKEVLDTILKAAEPKAGMRVLDLGCGTGNLSNLFEESDCDVWGIDFSKEMLTIARKKFPAVQFASGDVRDKLPQDFPEYYDVIVSAYVFHHFPIDEKITIIQRLMRENLKPGGKLIIGDLVFGNDKNKQETAQAYPDQWDEEYYWMLDNDMALLKEAGFQPHVTEISYCAAVLEFDLPSAE